MRIRRRPAYHGRVPSRILVTGFLPFSPHAANPSESIVRRLAAAPPPGVRLTTLVLPVVYGRAVGPVQEALDRGDIDVVLHLGLAAGRQALSFERFAVNWRGGASADESGLRLDGEPIDPAGPAAYLATIPVDRLVATCRAAGVPAEGSSHAGTVLCNQGLYQTLRYADVLGLPLRAGFLHLPEPRSGPDDTRPDDEALARGVAAAVRLLAGLPRPRRPAAGRSERRGTPARLGRPTRSRRGRGKG